MEVNVIFATLIIFMQRNNYGKKSESSKSQLRYPIELTATSSLKLITINV